jgi:hypothetical protein
MVGALLACSAAGKFYAKGYMKAVSDARKTAENSRHPAESSTNGNQ